MKKIFSAFIMIFPYLFALLTYAIIIFQKTFMTFVIMAVIMIMLFFVSFIITMISMIFRWEPKTALFFNLLMKIVYFPVHLILFIIMGGLANPFLLVLIPVPFIISCMFMGITGTISVAEIIRGYRNGNYKLSKAIICSLLSYCYIIDIIIAVILYIKANKCEQLRDDY